MNPIVKEKWLYAMRSGEYKWLKGSLKGIGAKFCTLGLLCELYRLEHPEAFWNGSNFNDGSEELESSLTTKVKEWSGIHDFSPKLLVDGRSYYVSTLNDGGFKFEDMANLIEKQY